MPDIKFATADVAAMKLGTTAVTKVMLGTVQVWPSAAGTDVLLEPFNNFTAAPWTFGGTPTIVSGRTGTAAQTSGVTASARYSIPAPVQSDTITVGFAWRRTDSSGNNRTIVQLYSDSGATNHNRVQWATSGQIAVTRAASSIATSATGVLAGTTNTWYYIEAQIKLHDTAGTAVVRVNGVQVINAAALDTKNAGTKTVYDQIWVGGVLTGVTHQYDDLYITSGAGAPFKGDITIP